MAKTTHSKYKNTGLLFELLVRQVTSDSMAGKNSPAIAIIKEFFKKGSSLSKEVVIYQTLLRTKFNSEQKADTLIKEVLSDYAKINKTDLKRQRYNLISKINEAFESTAFFKTKLPEYKVYASIYNVINSRSLQATDRVKNIFTLKEHICTQPEQPVTSNAIVKEFKAQETGLRDLTYKLLLEKFNKKYTALSASQKSLLKTYITHTTNGPELAEAINTHIYKVTRQLKSIDSKLTDTIQSIKINEVVSQLKSKIDKPVKDGTFTALLSSYELIGELKNG